MKTPAELELLVRDILEQLKVVHMALKQLDPELKGESPELKVVKLPDYPDRDLCRERVADLVDRVESEECTKKEEKTVLLAICYLSIRYSLLEKETSYLRLFKPVAIDEARRVIAKEDERALEYIQTVGNCRYSFTDLVKLAKNKRAYGEN